MKKKRVSMIQQGGIKMTVRADLEERAGRRVILSVNVVGFLLFYETCLWSIYI